MESELSILLFVIVLEALSSKIRPECPEKLLYATDLKSSSASGNSLIRKLEAWKETWESKGSRKGLE